jgi:3-oxoacyl-[acyl-carrier-protein] synthase-3
VSKQAIGIVATGSYLPKDEVGNDEIARRAGVTAEWIVSKTQIACRRYAAPEEATSDLATQAALDALTRSGLDAGQLSYVIVSTSTGDSPQPPTSYLVQHAIGADNAACFDINVVCSGFVYGLALADSLIAAQPDTYALVIGADIYSRSLDFTDRRTAALFGDGAGAAIVGAVPTQAGFVAFDLSSHGAEHNLIEIKAGGSRQPASHASVGSGGHYFRMDGRGVGDFVMEKVPPLLSSLVGNAGCTLDQVDVFVPHQPNGVLLTQLAERCGLAGARTARTLDRYGNVGSASVPVTLDDAVRSGLLRDGDLVLLAAFGGGMSIGACLTRWGTPAPREATWPR